MRNARAYVGTSGWSYADWRGRLYPDGVARGHWLEELARHLDDLREVTAPSRWKVAMEFRHDDWLTDDVMRLLDRQRAALCLHDMPGRAVCEEPNDVSFVYLRRHGPDGRYRRGYGDDALERDAERIRSWQRGGRTVYVYFNNDHDAHAPTTRYACRSSSATERESTRDANHPTGHH